MKYDKKIEKEHYLNRSYLNMGRWSSYWYQINEILDLKISSILEVGPGNNIVRYVLEQLGYEIKTLDIDEKINPDFIDDILNPKKINNFEFDLVLACQILEHLQYSDSLLAMQNLRKITKKYLIISLPIYDRFIIKIAFDFLGLRFRKAFCFNLFFPRPRHNFKGQHYWVIGKKDYELNKIRNDFGRIGFEVKKEFRPLEKSNHYFFILERK